jgi:hypothetical protein
MLALFKNSTIIRCAVLTLIGTAGCGRTDQSPPIDGPKPSNEATARSVSDANEQDASAFDKIGERYALLIGVVNYDKPSGLRPLKYTGNDVVELAKVLQQNGYRPENILLMTDVPGVAKPDMLPESRKIAKRLGSLLRDRGRADSILIAFAGHGVQFKGDEDSYFCPLDARVDDRETLLSMGDLYKKLEGCSAAFKLVLCDACRNDPLVSSSRGLRLLKPVERPRLTPPGGVAVFYSCSPGEVAYEDPDLKHGVFFNFVIDGLRGAADIDADGQVMLPELEYHAKRRVSDYVRAEIGGRRQMPNLKGNLLGLVSLAENRKSPAADQVASSTTKPAPTKPNPGKPPAATPSKPPSKPERPELDDTQIDRLVAALKSPDMSALRQALKDIAGANVVVRRADLATAIEPLLKHSDAWVRNMATQGLQQCAVESNIPALISLLQDKSFTVRHMAILTLAQFQDKRAAAAIAAAYDQNTIKAAQALMDMGPVAEDATWTLLDHPIASIRGDGCQILSKVGTARSLPQLKELASLDENGMVKAHATRAIRDIESR